MSLAAVNDHIVTAEIVHVTPEMAAQWLAKNMRNRSERPAKQAQYAKDMTDGGWLLTGESIKFDWNDEMIDGQNRCRALIASGRTVPMLIVSGLDPAVRGVVDTGVARTAADAVTILDGHPNAHLLSAVARLAVSWEKGFTWLGNYKATHTEIRQFINRPTMVEQLEESVAIGRRVARQIPGSASSYAFAHHACAVTAPEDNSREDAERFFIALAEGDGLQKSDPRLVLRNRLVKDSQVRGPAAEFEKRALIFRAWNGFRDGEALTKLQAPRGTGWTHKNFPKPY